jgi:hypothetical protein
MAGIGSDTLGKIKFIKANADDETQAALRKPDGPSINRVYKETKEKLQRETRQQTRLAKAAETKLADGVIVGDFREHADKIADGSLIDGWHRWTAHKKNGAEEIAIIVTNTSNETELLELAIARNAAHGLQLSQEDKRDMARRIYNATPERDRDTKKKHLATVLSVSERTVRDWLSNIDRDSKAARDQRIFDLWMACYSQEEIAAQCGCDRSDVDNFLRKSADLPNYANLPPANHAIDFNPPLYTVWTANAKSNAVSHFGNSEQRWVDNLG